MCYDISFKVEIRQLSDYFPDLIFDEQLEIDFNKAVHIMGHAHGEHPIIYTNREDWRLHCRLMEWGCIPHTITDEEGYRTRRAGMLNARSEKILDDPNSYWYKIRTRRCLMPVSGIYEHRLIKKWKRKIPYFISLKAQPLFFLPCLYAVAMIKGENGRPVKRWTYTLITRTANSAMSRIHNSGDEEGRMPLFLPLELSKRWVSEELTINEYREILNYRMPSSELAYHPVFPIRGSEQRPDEKGKNEPFNWPGIPPVEVDLANDYATVRSSNETAAATFDFGV